MTVVLRIPQAGAAMTEGTIVEWLVEDGATVAPGDILYRLDTDKTELSVEAPIGGVVRIVGKTGETYPVGDEVGAID